MGTQDTARHDKRGKDVVKPPLRSYTEQVPESELYGQGGGKGGVQREPAYAPRDGAFGPEDFPEEYVDDFPKNYRKGTPRFRPHRLCTRTGIRDT